MGFTKILLLLGLLLSLLPGLLLSLLPGLLLSLLPEGKFYLDFGGEGRGGLMTTSKGYANTG